MTGSSVATSTRQLQVSPSNSSFYASQLWFYGCQNNCTFQQGTVHRCNEWGKEVISTKPLPFVSVNVLNKGSVCAASRYSLHPTSVLCFTLRPVVGALVCLICPDVTCYSQSSQHGPTGRKVLVKSHNGIRCASLCERGPGCQQSFNTQ